MPSPKPPGPSTFRDPLSSPAKDADGSDAASRTVPVTTEETEFDTALDSFEAENPDSADDLENYRLEHTVTASRPSVEWAQNYGVASRSPVDWTPPADPPPVVMDAPIDEISADDLAISEALDSFYAEADVARGPRAARDAPADAVLRQVHHPPPRAQRSVSGAVLGFTAACGAIAAAIVAGALVLSQSQADVRPLDSSPGSPAPAVTAAVAAARPAPSPAAAAAPAVLPSADLIPSASPPAPPDPPALSPSAAEQSGVSAEPPVTPGRRGRESARQASARNESRAQLPPAAKSNATRPPTAKPTTPRGSLSRSPALTATGRGGSSRDDVPTTVPPLPPPAPPPAVSSPVNDAAEAAPPARAPEARPGVTPAPAEVNTSLAAVPSGTLPAPAAPVPAAPVTPPPAASGASGAGNAVAVEESAVRTVLNRYRSAYNGLNADAAKAIWPSVDVKALGRAFDSLESQEFDFAGCQIALDGARATAVCNGNVRFVPKVGNKTGRREPRHWTFEMRKANQQWMIDKVNVQ